MECDNSIEGEAGSEFVQLNQLSPTYWLVQNLCNPEQFFPELLTVYILVFVFQRQKRQEAAWTVIDAWTLFKLMYL